MSELLAWMIVVGLAVAIAGIFMLSSQIERHTRSTLEILIHSNELILAQLERGGTASLPSSDTMAEVVLERRRRTRRGAAPRNAPPAWERRVIADRRDGDLPEH